ncbi:MAG: hypothetical protein KC933_18080 [Myxococcales bacterium]|nr:hypothetical protein [Myxococcales bacterium]MCB9649552.1 hypothetical protein [Deltaproteobacteria bacterium]
MRALSWLALAPALLLTPTDARAQAASCPDRLDLMQRRFQAVPTHVPLAAATLPVTLPTLEGAKEVTAPGVVMDVKDGRVAFQGVNTHITALDGVWAKLEAVKNLEAMTKSPAQPLYLRLDAGQGVQTILPMLCRITPERSLYVLVSDPQQAARRYSPPPPPKHLEALVTKLDGTPSAVQRAVQMGEALEEAIGGCGPLRERFEALQGVPLELRSAEMKDAVLSGVAGCSCQQVDVDAVEALVLRILAPPVAQSYAVPFPLRCEGGKKATLRLPESADAAALAAALGSRKGGGVVRIRFEAAR